MKKKKTLWEAGLMTETDLSSLDEFRRLVRFVTRPAPSGKMGIWALAIAEENAEQIRNQLEQQIPDLTFNKFILSSDQSYKAHELIVNLNQLSADIIHVIIPDDVSKETLQALNVSRDYMAGVGDKQQHNKYPGVRARLIFWVTKNGDLNFRDVAWDFVTTILTIVDFT